MSSKKTQPLVLHAHHTGPNPYKIAIAMEALGVPYNVKLWEFGDGPNDFKGPQFLKINENGRVPVLEDPNTGVTSWESGACMNYVLRNYDVQNRFGAGPSEQEIVDYDKWIFFLVSTLGPMTGQRNWYVHLNPTKNEEALDRYAEQTHRCYGVLEGQLKKSGGGSILERGISAVDWHFYPWVLQHGYAGLNIDKYPLMQKWLEKLKGTEEVKRAYERIPKGEKA